MYSDGQACSFRRHCPRLKAETLREAKFENITSSVLVFLIEGQMRTNWRNGTKWKFSFYSYISTENTHRILRTKKYFGWLGILERHNLTRFYQRIKTFRILWLKIKYPHTKNNRKYKYIHCYLNLKTLFDLPLFKVHWEWTNSIHHQLTDFFKVAIRW